MIKYFDKRIVLTSQNPEAFINFVWEPGDIDSSINIEPISIPPYTLYVNGVDVSLYSNNTILNLNVDASIASFHLYTNKLYDFDYNIRVRFDSSVYDVSICNRPYITSLNTYETSNVQIDDETSYLVLRTNPKFTGNIKLSLDTSNNIYLDTFKVSDILNNKKYRKQKVSGEGVLSGDIRKTFSSLPYGELYRLDAEDTQDISLPKTEIYKQFNLNYSYGAKLFQDELYDDDYSLLAPLWINSKIPDYFAIFRLDGAFNEETYNGQNTNDLANKYLKNSKLIKSWSLKENTPIGKYLRNHLTELLNVRTPLFLSLSDPNQKDPDPNTWYGIAVDKGIITGRSETPYFFDQKNNFTDLNSFLSEGFERLNLLCPNLLNMEYIFSDEDVSTYTMHRYFGLYLTQNDLYNISYYMPNPNSSIDILSLDGKDSSSFFTSAIFDSSGNIVDDFKNRIFSINDKESLKRITNVNEVNATSNSFIDNWINKPGEQILTSKVESKQLNNFITLSIDNNLNQGEHLRIVDKTSFKIWEIYGIDNNLLNAGDAWTYVSIEIDSSLQYPTVYRTCFSTKGDKFDQIKAIKKAFDVFIDYDETPFNTTIIKGNQLSLEIKESLNDFWFQRLTAQTLNNPLDPSSLFNDAANYNDISFYGVFSPTQDDFERVLYDSSYGPINFELNGDRMSLMIKFQDASINIYSLDASVGNKIKDFTLYMGTDLWYRLFNKFNITTSISTHAFNYINDPYELDNTIIINVPYPIHAINGFINAYETYPLSLSLNSINPVKDLDYTVYDSSLGFKSEYWYKREDDINTWNLLITGDSSIIIDNRNSYEIISGNGIIQINNDVSTFNGSFVFNTFDASAYIQAISDVTICYANLDGTNTFKSYNNNKSEENLCDYYIDPSTKSKLKYGLTVPYVTKWVATGNDCRNNELRLIFDSSLNDSSTNFIPYGNDFNNELSYPTYKYLDAGDRAWEEYIFFDINDVIFDGSTYTSIKSLMFSHLYTDVFSKLIYSNNKIDKSKARSSIVYYNNYKNSIDTIISGLNLSFVLDETARSKFSTKDWDRYRISFISSSSKNTANNKPIEIIINENSKTILIVWYQGADTLNYNKRNSTYFGGKSIINDTTNVNNFESFKNNDRNWSFIKTPFVVNNTTLSSDIFNIYDIKNTYDSSICSQYAQLNWNQTDSIHSIFNAYSQNVVTSYSFNFFDLQYNNFKGIIDYTYLRDAATFGINTINYGYSYMNNSNLYKDNTCKLDTFKFILNNNNIDYTIINNDMVYTNFVTAPIITILNDPRKYKNIYTYNGWYKPKFNNIFEFNFNEDYISTVVNKDFIYSNTNFKECNAIRQLWYNKVVENVTSSDITNKNAIGFVEDFNIFKSQWDGGYYMIDGSTAFQVDGYNSSLELPSYFGSKLIKLPSSIILDSWDQNTANYEDGKNWNLLEFNITRKISYLFKSSDIFLNNWALLTVSDNVIDSYINKTILGYYNISKPKINVEIYSKPYNGSRISYLLDDSFIKNIGGNVDGNLNFINNEYVYSIKTQLIPNETYFVKFTLFEK